MLCGGGFLVVVVWAAEWVWAGRGLLLAEGRVAGALVSCLCGGGRGGWLPGAGIGDTPAAAWLVVVGAPACVGVACCRGSGAVRPGCLARLGLLVVGVLGWVWVGWL